MQPWKVQKQGSSSVNGCSVTLICCWSPSIRFSRFPVPFANGLDAAWGQSAPDAGSIAVILMPIGLIDSTHCNELKQGNLQLGPKAAQRIEWARDSRSAVHKAATSRIWWFTRAQSLWKFRPAQLRDAGPQTISVASCSAQKHVVQLNIVQVTLEAMTSLTKYRCCLPKEHSAT